MEPTEAGISLMTELIDHLIFCCVSGLFIAIAGFIGWGVINGLKRLFSKTMEDWGDAKKFIFEDICVYSLVIGVFLGSDYLYNFFTHIAFGVWSHPSHIGLWQALGAFSFLALLLRKLEQWRYYK